jgi:hypothetical protein
VEAAVVEGVVFLGPGSESRGEALEVADIEEGVLGSWVAVTAVA